MIELQGISKSWDGGRTFAVNNISLEVPTGKVLALLGGSGSGKSTTIKMINRLIEPTSGRILVNGEDITQQDPVLLRRRIGYVFQSIGLLPHMSVADNVTLLLKLQGVNKAERTAIANRLLDMVDLPSATFARRLPSELSGGQRQRVGFARALAAEPKVMLLDEPFGALDPVTRDTLQIEFLNIQKQLGLTAVIVTHDMAEALLLADVIAVMNEGEVLRVGTPRELLQDPGDDYVARLLETPRRHGELVRELSA